MIRTVLILSAILWTTKCCAQGLFGDDVSDEKTCVYFINSGTDQLLNSSNDTLSNFYVKGIANLRTLSHRFKIQHQDSVGQLFCGFDYTVYQTINNQIIRRINLNLKCSYAEINEEPYYLRNDSSILIPKTGIAYSDIISFDNISTARDVLAKALIDPKIIVDNLGGVGYLWSKYDGSFIVKTDDTADAFNEKLRKYGLLYDIQIEYDKDSIHLFTIYSDSELYNLVDKVNKGAWNPYDQVGIYILSTDINAINKYR